MDWKIMKNNVVDNLALVLQALSLQILFKDFNNSDLMQELQKQDKEYLEKIIQQNNFFIERNNQSAKIVKYKRKSNDLSRVFLYLCRLKKC